MNDFTEFEIESMGGCESFEFASNKSVSSIPNAINQLITSVVIFIGSAVFFKGLAIRNSLSFEETPTQTAGGEVYTTVISGMVPKLTAAYLKLFSDMTLQRFVVVVKDNNGSRRLCGTLRAGMRFSFDQSSSTTPAGVSGFKFQFSLVSAKPSPFYSV